MTVNDSSSARNKASIAQLREALDIGIAELDAGIGVETTPDQLIAEVFDEVGVKP